MGGDPMTARDGFGLDIAPTDRVRVKAWGYGARLIDCGVASPVLRINRRRVVIRDADGRERAVAPVCLGVLRRDGGDGYEANRPRCTCGARDHGGCFCDLSPRDFYAGRVTR